MENASIVRFHFRTELKRSDNTFPNVEMASSISVRTNKSYLS